MEIFKLNFLKFKFANNLQNTSSVCFEMYVLPLAISLAYFCRQSSWSVIFEHAFKIAYYKSSKLLLYFGTTDDRKKNTCHKYIIDSGIQECTEHAWIDRQPLQSEYCLLI